MPDPRQELMAAAQAPDAQAAFAALRWALVWASERARAVSAVGDDTEALRAVLSIDHALTGLGELDAALPPLIDVARVGMEVESYLHAGLQDRENVMEALGGLREAVADATRREEEFRTRVAELKGLRDRLSTLRRLERLAVVLGELEAQRQVIDDRLATLTSPVATAEQSLARGASDFIRLAEERRSILQPQIREALEQGQRAHDRLRKAESALAAQQRSLDSSRVRHKELLALYTDRASELRRHIEADRAVEADLGSTDQNGGGTGLDRARAALEEVAIQLAQIDGILARALSDQPEAGPRTTVSWNGVRRR